MIFKHYKFIRKLEALIGNTKHYKLEYEHGNLFTTFECQNFFRSIKDRAALFILKKGIKNELINETTVIIESTSGNFGIALAGICKELSLVFIPFIDPNISNCLMKKYRNIKII